MAVASSNDKQVIRALSLLTLNPENAGDALAYIAALSAKERDEFLSIADSNHVIIRSLEPLSRLAERAGNKELSDWANAAIDKEQRRIANALPYLHKVCDELEQAGCQTTVMKSLDHFPDLGNDLDLFSIAPE